MSAKKVVFVNRYFWPDESATSQILSDLAFRLASQGIAVEVITSNQLYTDSKKRLPAEEEKDGVKIKRVFSTRFGRANIPGRLLDYLTFYGSSLDAMLKSSLEADWLITKTDPPMMSIPGMLVSQLTGVKTAAWCQDVFPVFAFANNRKGVLAVAEELLVALRDISLNATDTVIVLGKDMRNLFASRLKSEQSLRTLPNWTDDRQITPLAPENNPLRASWGLEKNCVVGYSGNLGRVHEYATLLKAAEQLNNQPSLRLLFIGSGALHEKLKAEIPASLAEKTLFKPYQPREHLNQSLAVPDIHWFSLAPEFTQLVYPSKFYGILAAGRPSLFVGDTRSELAQIIQGEQLGFACEPGNSRQLANYLNELIENPELRQAMGKNARAYLAAHCTFESTALRWQNWIQQS